MDYKRHAKEWVDDLLNSPEKKKSKLTTLIKSVKINSQIRNKCTIDNIAVKRPYEECNIEYISTESKKLRQTINTTENNGVKKSKLGKTSIVNPNIKNTIITKPEKEEEDNIIIRRSPIINNAILAKKEPTEDININLNKVYPYKKLFFEDKFDIGDNILQSKIDHINSLCIPKMSTITNPSCSKPEVNKGEDRKSKSANNMEIDLNFIEKCKLYQPKVTRRPISENTLNWLQSIPNIPESNSEMENYYKEEKE